MNVIVILCDTLRRDHVSAYNGGKPLNECGFPDAPDWCVLTPNIDRIAEHGVVFDQCWCGSTPCMPARRDIYTGRYEFLERGWGPLEEDDLDLPRLVSGPPNRSLTKSVQDGWRISELITDHFHLWEQGAGNYHMGYSGFDFVRGCEADNYITAPVDFYCPTKDQYHKNERHWRNIHFIRQSEDDYFCAQVLDKAGDWLRQNRSYQDFYLHLDIFDPHEPWDPPERLLKEYDPAGYALDLPGAAPYCAWREELTPQEFNSFRARYAAKVRFLDERIGKLLDVVDELRLWEDTMIILTADHGTFNGDRGRIGKLQTHEYASVGNIPMIVSHPEKSIHGQHRSQLVQLVDIFPTVLDAVDKPLPETDPEKPIHGVSMIPAIVNNEATRQYAISGQFGKSVTITDGRWVLHQSPVPENEPLLWHGYALAKFLPYPLQEFEEGCRVVSGYESWNTPTWLSDRDADWSESINLADVEPGKTRQMQQALKDELIRLKAPEEQLIRLGLG